MQKNYLIAIALIVVIAVTFGFGYRTGSNAVKVEYQTKLNEQEAQADKILEENLDYLLATQAENDLIKYNLEKERQSHVKETNNLRTQFAASSLRFTVTGGEGGSDQVSGTANTSSNTNTASIELPKAITSDLRELAYDCDTLKDDYEVLYKFTNGIK